VETGDGVVTLVHKDLITWKVPRGTVGIVGGHFTTTGCYVKVLAFSPNGNKRSMRETHYEFHEIKLVHKQGELKLEGA
jgi:hypothetical protein